MRCQCQVRVLILSPYSQIQSPNWTGADSVILGDHVSESIFQLYYYDYDYQVSVVVLVRPGAPTISPRTPVATEGQSLNMSCSSEGGSPSPDIFWYMEVSYDRSRVIT